MLHGASYFRELALMADAGLTPAQILADSTLGGARLLGREADIGTIAPGKLADMVLLDADPLAGVANFSRKIGRAHVSTPVTNAQLVCRLLLEKKKQYTQSH